MISTFLEITGRYFSVWRVFLVGLPFGVLFSVLFLRFHARPESLSKRGYAIGSGLFFAMAALAFVWAWHLRWLSDDAYISFRYARNLVEGNGLVFNPGERVEGYTNFLWTILMAGAVALHLDPGQTSLALSLACFIGVLALILKMVRRLSPPGQPVYFSWAALLLGANYTFASYATSGLETMFATLLVTWALERAMEKKYLVSGLFGIGAVLAHPDHALFYAALGAVILFDPAHRKGLIRYALPFLFIYMPYFLLRWRYYGDIFPNTFYAKSADLFYFSQGFVYIAASLLGGGLWAALPLGVYEAFRRRDELLGRYLLTVFPLYLFYVAKIGGDFMLGRLFCPLMPVLFLACELGARRLIALSNFRRAAAGVLLSVLAALPVRILAPGEKRWQLADERTFYRLISFWPVRIDSDRFEWAEKLNRNLVSRGLRPKIADGCMGIMGYYTNLPFIDNYGLTDRTVAHQPIFRRGRPGHEKFASHDYLWRSGALLSNPSIYPEPYSRLTEIHIDSAVFSMVHYRTDFVKALEGEPNVSFLDFPAYLDGYLQNVHEKSRAEVVRDLAFFDEYYFKSASDPYRRGLLEAYLKETGQSVSNGH
jgi:hypothetical protein